MNSIIPACPIFFKTELRIIGLYCVFRLYCSADSAALHKKGSGTGLPPAPDILKRRKST